MLLIIETASDYSMPERVMVYDACEYERQILELAGLHDNERKDGYWEGKTRLSEFFQLPDRVRRMPGLRIPEYGFYLAEAEHVDAMGFET
ncbi:MAG: hypothetical protein NC392_06115, partial [Roseburia sp.]|nr:hypothetical protein [Roseburia sp.]MCM1202074.1 hypothetical protein [Bacteroides fragilis]